MFYYSFFIKVHIKPRKWAVMRMCRTCPCCYDFPIRFGTSLTVWSFFFHFIISGVSLNLLSFYALCFVIYQWNGSQIIIFMLCVLWYIKNDLQMIIFMLFNLWYTNGMVRTLHHNTPSYSIHIYKKKRVHDFMFIKIMLAYQYI